MSFVPWPTAPFTALNKLSPRNEQTEKMGRNVHFAREEILEGRIDSDTESPRGATHGTVQHLPGSTCLLKAVSALDQAKGSTCVGEV